MQVALGTLDAQAVRAERLQVRAARDEGDVGAGRRQASAEIAADAAAADDRDAQGIHRAILSRAAYSEIHVCPQDADSGYFTATA